MNDAVAIAVQFIMLYVRLNLAVKAGTQGTVVMVAEHLQEGLLELCTCWRLLEMLDFLLTICEQLFESFVLPSLSPEDTDPGGRIDPHGCL